MVELHFVVFYILLKKSWWSLIVSKNDISMEGFVRIFYNIWNIIHIGFILRQTHWFKVCNVHVQNTSGLCTYTSQLQRKTGNCGITLVPDRKYLRHTHTYRESPYSRLQGINFVLSTERPRSASCHVEIFWVNRCVGYEAKLLERC